jgi:hypothetical protein
MDALHGDNLIGKPVTGMSQHRMGREKEKEKKKEEEKRENYCCT